MKRFLTAAWLLLVAFSGYTQDDPDLVRLPVTGLPPGSRVVSYATLQTEARPVLVTEVRTGEGTIAFYIFDYIDESLRARPVGPRSIPGDLQSPPAHSPITLDVAAGGDRYWRADTGTLTDRTEQLVSAPSLAALTYAQIGASPWQLSPPPASALTIRHLSVAGDGSVLDECVIEPNITAVSDRMSTFGAWWVRPFGEPHLLVGMLHQGDGNTRLGGLRLYNERRELVAVTDPSVELDRNIMPDLLEADLSGDGNNELVFLATAAGASEAIAAFRFIRREGERRVLSFNLCSTRMNGPDIVMLQRALEGRGFSVGPHGLDGWYGPDTRAAVIRFQRAAGLPVTGVVGDSLWQLLGL